MGDKGTRLGEGGKEGGELRAGGASCSRHLPRRGNGLQVAPAAADVGAALRKDAERLLGRLAQACCARAGLVVGCCAEGGGLQPCVGGEKA
jgi:hypothetical protein